MQFNLKYRQSNSELKLITICTCKYSTNPSAVCLQGRSGPGARVCEAAQRGVGGFKGQSMLFTGSADRFGLA